MYNEPMSDLQWNSVPLEEEERPTVDLAELRRMAENLDPEEYDEPVQLFLDELMVTRDVSELHHAATMLLQDEVDLADARLKNAQAAQIEAQIGKEELSHG